MAYPDPTYGENPLDYDLMWFEGMRPIDVNDPEIRRWQATIVWAHDELAESNWLTRWRAKSVTTAEGVHLDAFGSEFSFPRPDGWDDGRYQPVVAAIDGASLGNRPPSATAALADGLVDGSQAWEMYGASALTYVVVFYGVTADEAQTYLAALEYGRPPGVRLVLAHSPDPKSGTFVLGESVLGGTDKLALIV